MLQSTSSAALAADEVLSKLSSLNLQPSVANLAFEVIIQEACLRHRYDRRLPHETEEIVAANLQDIVERPERLRAIKLGIAGAFARLNQSHKTVLPTFDPARDLNSSAFRVQGPPFHISFSKSKASLINHEAVAFVHNYSSATNTTEELPYPKQLEQWISDSAEARAQMRSEIPKHLSQGDLYLTTGSRDAIEGSIGTICDAVDEVCVSGGNRFCVVRPPGHHCGHSSPCGFCFVNLASIAAAQAHVNNEVDRVVIFDIDLHHGQGTQEIVWRVNQEAQSAGAVSPYKGNTPKSSPSKNQANGSSPVMSRKQQALNARKRKRPLRMMYASLHDILSYPCEDGDPRMVADASVRILGAHSQWISNVHLETYTSVNHFHSQIYPEYHAGLFGAAQQFLRSTNADPDRTLFIVSAGFDASEHEYPSMSRHNRRVPTSFYSRFARDLNTFAASSSSFAATSNANSTHDPRIISMLEGGYSDRALASGIASYITGFHTDSATQDWDLKDITALEKVCSAVPEKTVPKKPLADHFVQAGHLFDLLTGVERQKSDWQRGVVKEPVAAAMRTRGIARNQPPKAARDVSPPKSEAAHSTPILSNEATFVPDFAVEIPPIEPEVLPQPIPVPLEVSSSSREVSTASETESAGDHLEPVLRPTSSNVSEAAVQQSIKLVWRSQGIE